MGVPGGGGGGTLAVKMSKPVHRRKRRSTESNGRSLGTPILQITLKGSAPTSTSVADTAEQALLESARQALKKQCNIGRRIHTGSGHTPHL